MPLHPRWSRFVLLLLFALPALAGNHQWTIDGPFGGWTNQLAYDPADASIAYASGPNGLFRSTDGGRRWIAAAELLGKGTTGVAIATSDPNVVYASSVYGLYKSVDRGSTWRRVHPFASFAVAVSATNSNIVYSSSTGGPFRSNDGGATFGPVGSGLESNPGARSIAVDPQNSNIVYITTFSNEGVFRSEDGGAQWTPIRGGITSPLFHTIVVHPTDPHILFLGTLGAMYRSTNSGASWTKLGVLSSSMSVSGYAFAISPTARSIVYAGTERGVLRSTDGGVSWTVPLQATTALSVAVDPVHPQNVLAGINADLRRSSDGGTTFTISDEGLTAFSTDSIVTDARFPSRVYASGPAGFARSDDRGKTWTTLSSTRVFDAVLDPVDSSIIYGLVDGMIRRSTDGGVTWTLFGGGNPVPTGVIQTMRVDPRNPGTIYVVVSGSIYRKVGSGPWTTHAGGPNGQVQFLTIDPTTSTLYAGGADGVFRSTDGGVTWTPPGSGTSAVMIGAAVDPFDANHLFAWNFNHAAFESHDAGASWIARPNVSALLMFDPANRGVVYAHMIDVERSVDGGATFQPLRSGDVIIDTDFLAIAPDGKTLYAGGSASGVWTYEFGRRRAATH